MKTDVAEALERVERDLNSARRTHAVPVGPADLRILIDAVRSGSSRDLAQSSGAHAMGEGRHADAWVITYADGSGDLVFTEEEADDLIAEARPGATKRPLFSQPEPLTVPETPRHADALQDRIGERIADEVEKACHGRQTNCEQAAADILAMLKGGAS